MRRKEWLAAAGVATYLAIFAAGMVHEHYRTIEHEMSFDNPDLWVRRMPFCEEDAHIGKLDGYMECSVEYPVGWYEIDIVPEHRVLKVKGADGEWNIRDCWPAGYCEDWERGPNGRWIGDR